MSEQPTPINRYVLYDPERMRGIIDAFDDACRSLDQPPSEEVRANGTARNCATTPWHTSRL